MTTRRRRVVNPEDALSVADRSLLARAREFAGTLDNLMFGEMYVEALRRKLCFGDDGLYVFLSHLEQPPVSIETFLDSPQFLKATDINIWPYVRDSIIRLNKYWWKGVEGGAFREALLAGATSTAKTTIAIISQMYHLHILGCLKQPQTVYGLPKATSIVIAIMAAKPHVTKKVVYLPLRKMLNDMPWFLEHMPMDKYIESECVFIDKNIRITLGGADADSILGEAVISGIIDEINFMNIVLRSKKAEVTSGRVGVFDQAKNIYETMTRRKEGRFISRGPMVGVIVVSSSTRYKGDFTDKRMQYVEDSKEQGVFLYRPKQYEVWPASRYSGKTFRLLVGNDVLSDTRVLDDVEEVPEGSLVLDVPIEYKVSFEKSPHDSLRDVVGISTNSISPFFRRRFKILECITAGEEAGLASFLVNDHVILGKDSMPMVKREHYCTDPSRPRYVHIDLSLTGDRCGISMVKYSGLVSVTREGGAIEQMPVGTVELACSIEPDAQNEIDIAEVRMWVKHLKDRYGYPIKVVTYDGYQSRESMQQWKKQGMRTGYFSVDRTSTPYKQFRDAINDGRVLLPENQVLLNELFELEYDASKDKVDHPSTGSKDVADAVCAAYCVMVERRSSWLPAAQDDEANANQLRAMDEDRFDEPRRM